MVTKMTNKKIAESRNIIKKEKQKIKEEKKKLRQKKLEKSFIKDEYNIKEMAFNTLFSFIIGAFLCFGLITLLCGGKNIILLSKDLSKFIESYETITKNYYGDIDKKALVDNAIYGMTSSIDDAYTTYSNIEVAEEFNALVNGTYEGIGCTIQQVDKIIKVIEIYDNTPAMKAGLEVDDIILKVDDITANEKNVTDIANYIKNKKESTIEMVILRNKEEKNITITRSTVETPVVSSKVIKTNNKKIGYISISIFSKTSYNQFKKNLEKLEKDNIEGLIIDVRGNSGGYLTSVTDILSTLLPKDKILYQTNKKDKIEIYKDKTIEKREYPIAVLINGGSASASEILAAAIKESYEGFIVGKKSYGKGTVQEAKTLSDGSMLKYTTENWLSPNGNWIDKQGVTPTNEVDLSDEYIKNPIEKNDNQLSKALELVSK